LNTSGSVLRQYAEAVNEVHDLLTALDQVSGDGDFGDNLQRGLDLVMNELDSAQSQGDAFSAASGVFLDHVGGTSGPLIGLLFQELAAAEETDGSDREQWLHGLTAGVAAIQRVGEAQLGDRTMLDALIPARDSLTIGGTIADAAEAALTGAKATALILARHGRSSYVGSHALGTPDPGAMGLAILLWAAYKVQDQNEEHHESVRSLFLKSPTTPCSEPKIRVE
jgi:dihydroxyacetone kinase-like protein